MDPTTNTYSGDKRSRRNVLKTLGAAGVSLLAGCANDKNTTETNNRTDNSNQETETETDLLEQTHSAENLDEVVQELEQNNVALNFQPADQNAEYANSTIFNNYNGELNVEIDLGQAFHHRHTDFPRGWGPRDEQQYEAFSVQTFIDNVSQQNTKWVEQINNEFAEHDGNEYLPKLRDEVDFEKYKNSELGFETRMAESGIYDLWTKHEIINLPGGGGSELNQFMAAALQGTEQNAGFNTFIWDYIIPGHGLAGAIENPTRDEENTDQQQTYILETDDRATAEQRIQTWNDSPYRTGDGVAPHYAHPNNNEENIYRSAVTYNPGRFNITVNDSQIAERFDQLYREPDSIPAHDLLDPLMSANYADDKNNQVSVTISEGEITLST